MDHDLFDEPSGPCQHCEKRPATTRWAGEGSFMDALHGNYTFWCDLCCLKAQLEHAQKLATTIPALEQEIKRRVDGSPPTTPAPKGRGR